MLGLLISFLLLAFSDDSAAQSSVATCSGSTYDWAFNSLGQTPCVMASYMLSPCGGYLSLPALDPGWAYSGANKGKSNPCHCSSTIYSLFAVCQLCQPQASRFIESWGTFIENCTALDVQNGFFVQGIPEETAIPIWAYRPYDTLETFNVTEARQKAFSNRTEILPSSSSTPVPSTPIASSVTLQSTPTVVPSPSRSISVTSGSDIPRNDDDGGSSTPVGPIVGGVVGGVAGVAILFGLAMYFIVHQNRKAKQSSAPPPSWNHTSPTLAPTPVTVESKPYGPPSPSNGLPSFPYHPNRPEV